MSKLAKFFIICAAVCVLGIVMTFAGYAAGGVDNMGKVAEKHEWLNVGPDSSETDLLTVGDFKSIEAEGSLDIAIVSTGQEMDEGDVPELLETFYEDSVAGTVAVRWGKGGVMPEVKNENGVLKIKGSTESIEHVEVNLSGEDPSPDVVVFCSDKELESISINGKYGDISIAGVNAKNTSVNVESGDIELEGLTAGEVTAETTSGDINADYTASSKMSLKAEAGDIYVEGCDGEISAETTYGDIEFETKLPKEQYEITVSTNSGTISIGEVEIESENEFSLPGGPNKLTLKTDTGDIDADFAD